MERLLKISDYVNKVCIFLTVGGIIGFSVVMALQIFLRNLLPQHALPWADGVCRYFFIWSTFTGAAVACRYRKQITITILIGKLKGNARRFLIFFNSFVFVMVMACVCYASIEAIAVVLPQQSDILPISAAWIYAAIPLGMLLSIFQVIVTSLEEVFVLQEFVLPEFDD